MTYGTLRQTDTGPQLRFVRQLNHPPAKVWQALTLPEHLTAWFPDGLEVDEWVPGARLRFAHATDYAFDGEVIAVEEERLLEFRWGTDVIRFELEPDGDGTRLILLDTLDTVGKAARDGAGWHVCLDQFERHLDATSTDESTSDQWRRVHGAYVDAFGPEAATIGPPDGALN
jgi:uncharacterized protein YndB with AHSA1/START domain